MSGYGKEPLAEKVGARAGCRRNKAKEIREAEEDERRETAGRSESAKEEIVAPPEGRRAARERMLARCLEMDSHQECIGSLSVAAVEGGGWWRAVDEEEVEEDESLWKGYGGNPWRRLTRARIGGISGIWELGYGNPKKPGLASA
ncbi:hypothetical protein F3Y22_tig00111392pilonHSYRG00096 [Hibiscus syriacus]|uniref:Uncharacterized protein n=1 Tax=Hibiscus syriacus TaxID=106335 RepID=A0A6A2XW68_HIBSY|nr:hypothetical protein F3Y22_tig00111392pilonHSYRG00096 [Hibiscus syriacus]